MRIALVIALLLLLAALGCGLYVHLTSPDNDELPPLPHGYIGDYAGAPKTQKSTDPATTDHSNAYSSGDVQKGPSP